MRSVFVNTANNTITPFIMKTEEAGTWVSWNENIKHPFKQLLHITTESELIEAIKSAPKVRFFGNKQSSADIAAGSDVLIDMRTYNNIVSYDDNKRLITVQSGTPLVDLIEAVEAKNWCIPCLPDINTVTVGGALATGTHGTSGHLLSEYIHSCSMVLADGDIKTVQKGEELLDAIKVSLGVLGVLSEITFKCEPTYTLHLKEGPERDSVWLKNIKSDLKQYDFLRILWLPHTGKGYSIKGEKIDPDKKINVKNGPGYLKYRRAASKILYKNTHKYPWFTAIANKLLYLGFFRSQKEHKGTLYQATVTKSRGSTLELAEWTVGLDKFPEVFKELKATINNWKNDAFIHIPMDVRFVKADKAWLSYAYEEDIVTMGCVCRNAAAADEYEAFKTVEEIFLKYGGKPHWGKRFEAKDAEMAALYPKWSDFKALRKDLDPKNKFLNPYLASLFGE